MEIVIQLLKTELQNHRKEKVWFQEWLKEAKLHKNEYGIQYYGGELKRIKEAIPEIEKAIKILNEAAVCGGSMQND